MDHQTADPRVNVSVFLSFPAPHFLESILAKRTNGRFTFAQHTSQYFEKPKESFFPNNEYQQWLSTTKY